MEAVITILCIALLVSTVYFSKRLSKINEMIVKNDNDSIKEYLNLYSILVKRIDRTDNSVKSYSRLLKLLNIYPYPLISFTEHGDDSIADNNKIPINEHSTRIEELEKYLNIEWKKQVSNEGYVQKQSTEN